MIPTLARFPEELAVAGFVGSFIILFIAVVGGLIRSIVLGRARERTKQEIAAYIAEGSMTAEQGEKLIRADKPAWERGEGAWARDNSVV
jgi:hypothetical protein